SLPESRSRRNVYRRTACEYTILRLLETNKLDADLCPVGSGDPASGEARHLVEVGLRDLLGGQYERYGAAPPERKRDVIMTILSETLRTRAAGIYAFNSQP
ncbi:MAG TPA: hypothetical protein VFN37_11860, partial [Candidatus Baltobacteraceae bacterium]|nr:hypothetical protein [Candidatus Baltobacteraceae bacterium]